jgi:hypothetical protein
MYKCKASHGHDFANNIGEGGEQSIMPVFWVPQNAGS